jgi:hypothetical protein
VVLVAVAQAEDLLKVVQQLLVAQTLAVAAVEEESAVALVDRESSS